MTTIEANSSTTLVERLFAASLGAFDLFSVYLGERLGLYAALASTNSLSPEELADTTSIDVRYAQEWLEQQAASGIIDYADGRFRLPPGHAAVLAQRDHPDYFAPISRMIAAAGGQLPELVNAVRTGGGISWDAYGADMVEGQSELNRPFFMHQLGTEVLPAIPEVHAKLSQPAARVAEIGFGGGWASIAIAQAYGGVTVDGFDPDALSCRIAAENASGAGLSGRTTFHRMDGAEAAAGGRTYDLVCAFECIHDMADPVSVLRSMRALAGADGLVLVMDERVPDQFTGPGDDVERFMYGWSVTTCLPNGLAESPSAATGTVLRLPILERYATEAGFFAVQVLDIENDFFRFYVLR